MTEYRVENKQWMPPEWHVHRRCWMAWPSDDDQWPCGLERAAIAFAEITRAIARFEPVIVVVNPDQIESAKLHLGLSSRPASAVSAVDDPILYHPDRVTDLDAAPGIQLMPMALNDSWMRDIGPTFVFVGRQLAGVDWGFNGWGKFPHELDALVAKNVLAAIGIERIESPIINEGGGIHVDGQGTVLLTESVQLNPNRNPGFSKADIEAELCLQLGVQQCIWLPRGVVDDDTDGHIDELACFVAPGKILALISDDPEDANYDILQTNLDILQQAKDVNGQPFEVITIRQPPARYLDGTRLSMSYVNFYIANGGIVMPSYGEAEYDAEAKEMMQRCFPEYEIIQVNCLDIVVGGGNIHCITQQEPQIEELT
ncbi:MAG: agmatine deiminase family protein [Pseudomonadales bacterium]|nr:agmatine deiminase family protein [Pseudomonadales bacterium]